jgi:hypothetical protein
VILTGDLHANATNELDFLTPEYLRSKFCERCENTLIFILGDGGFLWYDDPYAHFGGELIRLLDSYLYRLNSKLIVVPGNHENYHIIYDCLPKVHLDDPLYTGDFREISPYILYTERYGEYTFEGKSVLVLGGALSLDREIRVPNRTWFQAETYSIEDKDKIMSFIRDNEYDYVFAHTCPDLVLRQIYGENGLRYRDGNSEFYTRLMNYISPKTWYFGHLHPEKIDGEYNYGEFDNLKLVETDFRCLFKDIQAEI